jgi:hypothetical protein
VGYRERHEGHATQGRRPRHVAGRRRNLAFGLFYTGYGAGWLAGSTTTGVLYEHSVAAVIGFSIVVQLASLPLFIAAERMRRREGKGD